MKVRSTAMPNSTEAEESPTQQALREQQVFAVYAAGMRASNAPTERGSHSGGNPDKISEYGSFRDSLKAPVHRWFTYPAGYSYKFVEAKINQYGLNPGSTVGDPFLGTGTTSLAARKLGVHSVGVEAHRFVHWVAATKLYLNHDVASLEKAIADTVADALSLIGTVAYEDLWPALVYKCFDERNLAQLAAIRTAITRAAVAYEIRDFLKLALTSTLRIVTTAGAGWPYIAPSKYAAKKVTREAVKEFDRQCRRMLSDVNEVQELGLPFSSHEVILGDARAFDSYTGAETIDLMVTSPPYLNNYDYADRTRLETYFWGETASWADITREIRDHLIVAATTQVSMSALNGVRKLLGIREVDSEIHAELASIVGRLAEMRAIRAGKKTYDYVVAAYFEDMLRVLQCAWKALKPGAQFVLVVGDSAPYGVHVATENFLGRIGIAVGFSSSSIEELRTRGGKWGNNPQRHKTQLRESVLTLTK